MIDKTISQNSPHVYGTGIWGVRSDEIMILLQ